MARSRQAFKIHALRSIPLITYYEPLHASVNTSNAAIILVIKNVRFVADMQICQWSATLDNDAHNAARPVDLHYAYFLLAF